MSYPCLWQHKQQIRNNNKTTEAPPTTIRMNFHFFSSPLEVSDTTGGRGDGTKAILDVTIFDVTTILDVTIFDVIFNDVSSSLKEEEW